MSADKWRSKTLDLTGARTSENDVVFCDGADDPSSDVEVFDSPNTSPNTSPFLQHRTKPGSSGDHEPLRKTSSYFSKLQDMFHHRSKPSKDPLSSSDGFLSPHSHTSSKPVYSLTPPLSASSNRRISAPSIHAPLRKYHSKPCTSSSNNNSSSSSHVAKGSSGTGVLPVSVWVSGAGEDSDASSTGGGLQRCSRFYGSTGNILEMTDGPTKTNLTKRHLGKSLQLLPTSPAACGSGSELGPFRVETGLDCGKGQICGLQTLSLHEHALLENPESETRWYFKYFLGKYHCNYLCYDVDRNPVFLSVVPLDSMDSIYRCIVWKKTGNKRLSIKHDSKGKSLSPKTILEKCSVKVDRNIKEIHSPAVQKDLLTLEEQEGSVSFKFGVLYARAGQKSDDDMYCNQYSSERLEKFLELLGDEVQLRGWEQFRGGLDCKNDSTGLSSVYTVFEGHEIMFHVSTLLPYTAGNKQQLERKRHIGNDIVVIIFVDYDVDPEDAYQSALEDFDPSCMKSHFNHIFALVSYNHITECYRLVIYSAESVPEFGPPLPYKGEFTNSSAFRDFLLAKLINGEKAAYCTPTFAEKRERTLGLLLKGLEEDYSHEMRRVASTPALNHSPSSYKKFNEREHAFTEFGQRLKVEKIITGHHPTSMRTTVAPKREPWETECVAESFPFKITHGDICDEGALVVATPNNGSYLIYRDGGYSQVMDAAISVGQLVIAHRHNLFLFRTNYVKEVNHMYAIPLKDLFTPSEPLVKQKLSRYQIPHTKHVSLFCTSPLSDQFLRLAVAAKTKVTMMAYKHPASMVHNGSPITPLTSTAPKDTFIKHRELTLLDTPSRMALLDERPSGKLCVTYQKLMVVDAIDEIKATTQRLPSMDLTKSKVTSLTTVHSNGYSELLIGYNLTCQLITLHDNTAYNSTEIVWNMEPRDLVYLHPYMLAFTEHTIEIRMAANSSLMHTINVPDLHLISSKSDIYFTSSSPMVHAGGIGGGGSGNNSARGSALFTHSMSQPSSKFPKNIDKKDFVSSSKFTETPAESTYVYRINMESMTGRRDSETPALGSTASLRHSLSDDSISRTDVVSIVSSDDCTSDGSTLDYIHPKDDDVPVIHTSFEEEDAPIFSIAQQHHNNSHHQHQSHHHNHSHHHHHHSHHHHHHHHQPHHGHQSSKGQPPSRVISRETSSSFPQNRNHSQPALHRPVESRSNSFGPISSSNNGRTGASRDPGVFHSQFSVPLLNGQMSGSSSSSTRLSPPCEAPGQQPVRIKRSKRVLTSRKSLESTSRYLHPSPEHVPAAHKKLQRAEYGANRYGHSHMAEMLGAMDNPSSSPDSGVHDDFSLPSNYSEHSSNTTV